jgi:hypothetical protein
MGRSEAGAENPVDENEVVRAPYLPDCFLAFAIKVGRYLIQLFLEVPIFSLHMFVLECYLRSPVIPSSLTGNSKF